MKSMPMLKYLLLICISTLKSLVGRVTILNMLHIKQLKAFSWILGLRSKDICCLILWGLQMADAISG